MSCPGFVIVCRDDNGADTSVLTGVLDQEGNQKVVSLTDACNYRPIPCPDPNVSKNSTEAVPKPKHTHRCAICHLSFSKQRLLRQHMRVSHSVSRKPREQPPRTYTCALCEVLFETEEQIEEHLVNSHNVDASEKEDFDQYIIRKATKKARLTYFSLKASEKLDQLLVKDAQAASEIRQELEDLKNPPPKRKPYVPHKKYPCPVCGKAFSSPTLLSRHSVVHTRAKLYHCPHCNKACSFTDERLRHIRHAHPEMLPAHSRVGRKRTQTSYTCKTCDDNRTFTTRAKYAQHLRVHLGHLFRCHLCPKRFIKRDSLLRHISAHEREKKHKCDMCKTSFADSQTLERHRQIHTCDFPHKCPICGKGFTKKPFLYKHLERHNRENTTEKFQCLVCRDLFDDQQSLAEHRISHDQITGTSRNRQLSVPSDSSISPVYQTTIFPVIKAIPATFTFSPNANSVPAKIYPTFDCSVCKQSFRSAEELQLHGRIHVAGKNTKPSVSVFLSGPI